MMSTLRHKGSRSILGRITQVYTQDLWNSKKSSFIPVLTEDITQDDIVIAVIGATGTGKTSFINRATGKNTGVGDDLVSETERIGMVKYRCLEKSLRDVVFVDTPGFDHAGVDGRVLTDRSIVEMLLDWMKKTTGLKIKITAILYFHRISDNRMGAAPIRHLRILRKLCGDDALRRVILTTTMWDLEVPSTCYQREEELKREPDFWKTTLDHGATVARHHHTEDSAWNIIDSINRAHHGDWKEELEAELDKLQREIGLKVVNLRLAAYNLRDKLEEIRRGHREGETESYLQRRREEYEALRRDYEQEFNNLAKHKAKPGFCLKRLSSVRLGGFDMSRTASRSNFYTP